MKIKSFYSLVVMLITMMSLINLTNQLSIVEIFGLQPLLQDLVKGQRITHYTGQQSIQYALTPELFQFMKKFQSRTGFCDYKCPNFYEVPCFILFQCNIHIRNFFLIIIFPLITVMLIGICCGKGIWTFGCWARYLGLFTGIFFIFWFMKKFVQGRQVNKRRQKQKQYINEQRIQGDLDVQNIYTQKRMIDNQ